MYDLVQLRVRDAKLPTPYRSHTRDGGMLERVTQSVSADHACRSHDRDTCLARCRNVHSRSSALATTLMPLILKNLADVRSHKLCFRDPVDIASNGKVSDRSCIALRRVVNQAEMDSNRVFTV